jgi:hypothetical protein
MYEKFVLIRVGAEKANKLITIMDGEFDDIYWKAHLVIHLRKEVLWKY